ncbi:MAG: 4Fe-4S dicluster domain-containing protein [Deltaproteobacteria bacterium]|nr:4Fe-4S dicluster domain-containing protein [Deltaproteobacteria bacterium]MBW2308422.1 4Fe-4S dicluster domain-containing protein [Deltaproteobacteria bacterium]
MAVYRQITDGDPEGAVAKVLALVAEALDVQTICAPFYVTGREAAVVEIRDAGQELPPVAFLEPSYQFSLAGMLSRMARSSTTVGKMVALLRPCDHRALVELAKLRQIPLSSLITVVFECPGTIHARDVVTMDRSSLRRLAQTLVSSHSREQESLSVREACRACLHLDFPVADVQILWRGADPWQEIYWREGCSIGLQALTSAGLVEAELPEERARNLDRLRKERLAFRQDRIERFSRDYQGPEGMRRALSSCIGCMSCRQVCPLCYCRACVFHGPDLETPWETAETWLKGRNALRLPLDTLLYHMVRMNHMAHGCVACGLCGQACPMDVPVDLLFLVGGKSVQEALNYKPGERPDEQPPQGTFREDEFTWLGR